jgi:GAF domain-containing protein/HAMP domain-containing protein
MESEINKPKTSRSLTTTLAIAFFSLSVVVLLVSSGLQLFSSFQTQRAALAQKQEVIAQEAGKSVSSFIEEQFSVLETAISLSDPVSISNQERETVLESLLGLQPAFRQVVLLNDQDIRLAEASRLAQTSSGKIFVQLTEEALTQIHQGQRYISSIYIDDATSEPLVVMALPVTDIFGNFQGTLAVEVNLKFMWDLVDQLKVGETGYAYVVDNTGNLIAFNDTGRVLRGENVQNIFEVSEFVKHPTLSSDQTQDVVAYTGLLGTTVVGTYVPLGTPEWAVVTELPWREAYREFIQQGVSALAITLGIAFLAGLLGIFVARRLSNPLMSLLATANEVANGNLTAIATVAGPTEIAQVASTFNAMTSRLRELVGNLEQRVAERTTELEQANQQVQRRAEQFEAIAQISRVISSIQNHEELLNRITRMISQYFGFYHAGIFLLDDKKQYAVLRAANSEGGRRMLERGHRLQVGQTGIVGFVTSTGNPRIALDTGTDAIYFDNPDLPETHSEMALPLKIRGQVVGALDVQSTVPNAFTQEDINILLALADQVGAALENARLHEEAKDALSKAETAYRQLTSTSWSNIQRFSPIIGYRFDGTKAEPLNQPTNGTQFESRKEAFSVPVQLRGESIGRLRIKPTSEGYSWTDDEIAIIQATAERVALAVENARLVLESQKRASKEQIIGEASTKISSAINLDNILQTTLREMGRILPGAEISIQIENE